MRYSDSKQVPKLYAFPISFSMNKPISKCNKQHSNPNDAKVKKIIPFSQTKSNYFFLKQLSNFLKVPKVRFDRTRSRNFQMQNDAQEAITWNNERI